ncbi:hypothetical protein I7F96_25655 [Sinorhizobium meliloti]|nr:hypothetical protein [Sinorhizobium meliloti]MDE3774314.1 hypothetical protein [Sinorhizobium meliloti]QND34929.1 hypothetical protein HB772_23945 [Sinorhizobium meliloti]
MDDRDTNHNGEKNSASDLLEIAAQLAALAEDIKTLAEPGDRPEASSE